MALPTDWRVPVRRGVAVWKLTREVAAIFLRRWTELVLRGAGFRRPRD
ncbi:MAG TPA: hypothetical protein P5079_06855 [Elusimicrobiota bacterium]|nr:hypothetical protein [Elusimicrobiota bacterium]